MDPRTDPLLTAYIDQSLAKARLRLGDHTTAGTLLTGCLRTCTDLHDRLGVALVRRTFGELHLARGALAAAERDLDCALRLWDELELPLWRARTLRDLGGVAARRGDIGVAEVHWASAAALFSEYGTRESGESAQWPRHWA